MDTPTFFLTTNNSILSHKAVRANFREVLTGDDPDWTIVAVTINWGDPDLYCDETHERIPSAYGEPEDDR